MENQNAALTPEELQTFRDTVKKAFSVNPPTIGVIGVSGVGKSSTINSLFKTSLATSDTIRCTTEFKATDLSVDAQTKEGRCAASLRVVDAPGLGEDIRNDSVYLDMYKEHLPHCDVILWVMAARNRAVALDQRYLEQLSEFRDRIVFGINQIDLVEPLDWNGRINMPSTTQDRNINEIVADRRERLSSIIGKDAVVIPYGAKQKFGLAELFEGIINHCSTEKRWMFSAIKKITPAGFLDAIDSDVRDEILRRANDAMRSPKGDEQNRPKKKSIGDFFRSRKTK